MLGSYDQWVLTINTRLEILLGVLNGLSYSVRLLLNFGKIIQAWHGVAGTGLLDSVGIFGALTPRRALAIYYAGRSAQAHEVCDL